MNDSEARELEAGLKRAELDETRNRELRSIVNTLGCLVYAVLVAGVVVAWILYDLLGAIRHVLPGAS